MYQTVVNIGCFILYIKDKKASYCFAVQSFDIDLALDSIPSCVVQIKDVDNSSLSNIKNITKYSKAGIAYNLAMEAQRNRQLLDIELVQYKQDLTTKSWFKGKLCSVSMSSKGSIERSNRGVICNCRHALCQLQYNYLTQSVYTPGTSAITFDMARRIFNYSIQGVTPKEGWGNKQKDINSVVAKSNPNIKTDSILDITQKAVKQLLKVREQRYKASFSVSSNISNLDIDKYFKTQYFITPLLIDGQSLYIRSKSSGNTEQGWHFLQHFYNQLSNNVIQGTLAQSLLSLFAKPLFLRTVPSGKEEKDNKIKIVPSSFNTFDQKNTQNIITLKDAISTNVSYDSIGMLYRPQALLVCFNPSFSWRPKTQKAPTTINEFGIYPASLRSQNNKRSIQHIRFLQGPAWMQSVASKVQQVENKNGAVVPVNNKNKARDPRALEIRKTPIQSIRDTFAKQIYFAQFAPYSTAIVELVVNNRSLYEIDKHMGQTFKFQALSGYQKNKAVPIAYYGVLGSLSYSYANSIEGSRMNVSASFNFVIQSDSQQSYIYTKSQNSKYSLYVKKESK